MKKLIIITLIILAGCSSDKNTEQPTQPIPSVPTVDLRAECESSRVHIWFEDMQKCKAFEDMDMPSLNLLTEDQDLIYGVQRTLMVAYYDIIKNHDSVDMPKYLTIFGKLTLDRPVVIVDGVMLVNPTIPSIAEMQKALLDSANSY